MIWFLLMQVFSTILQIILFRRQSEQEKDLEILLLKRQLAILERHHTQRIQVSRVDKLTLTVLASPYGGIIHAQAKPSSNAKVIMEDSTQNIATLHKTIAAFSG